MIIHYIMLAWGVVNFFLVWRLISLEHFVKREVFRIVDSVHVTSDLFKLLVIILKEKQELEEKQKQELEEKQKQR